MKALFWLDMNRQISCLPQSPNITYQPRFERMLQLQQRLLELVNQMPNQMPNAIAYAKSSFHHGTDSARDCTPDVELDHLSSDHNDQHSCCTHTSCALLSWTPPWRHPGPRFIPWLPLSKETSAGMFTLKRASTNAPVAGQATSLCHRRRRQQEGPAIWRPPWPPGTATLTRPRKQLNWNPASASFCHQRHQLAYGGQHGYKDQNPLNRQFAACVHTHSCV